jgi:branched-subunit amino acid aminotransferase/4-amino-4-deoxychorismate lyase
MVEPLVYLNGRTLPASQAHLAIYDAGIVLGATVTEMTRTFRHQPFRLDDHLRRLFRSLRYVQIDIGLTSAELAAISHDLLAHNARLLGEGDELGLIHFVTPGEYRTYAGSAGGASRQTPTVCVHTFPLPWELWADKLQHGAHVVTPSIRHVPPQCYDPKIKYRSRLHYFLADKEARNVDPAAVALLLDLDGNVTETSGSNFLIVDQGALVAPTLRNTLPGVSRRTVIELAGKLGVPCVERDFQVYDVMNADEAWLTSTPYCMLPAVRINGAAIGEGRPGPVFRQFLSAWGELVGVDIEQQILAGALRRGS